MQDLGTLGGPSSYASGINDSGEVVGWADNNGGFANAFLWESDTGMEDLGALPSPYNFESEANGINNNGNVVGWSESAVGSYHAFLYSNGTMEDLNSFISPSSGWTLESANAINDNGQIVGYGLNPSGQTDAFLLTPVPEPSTFALLAASALGLAVYAWRKRRR